MAAQEGAAPQEPQKPEGFTFADLFAGIGGIRRGFEAAGGRCVFTSEWNPHAQKTYRANFKDEHPIAGDITKVKAKDIPDHDVLVGGFPCFGEGTLVHSARGLRPIEEIRAGDFVLGCSGAYRMVNAAMLKDGAPTREVRVMGCPALTTTDEHPFWARRSRLAWDNSSRRYKRVWGEPAWMAAKDLDEDCFVGLPIDKPMDEAMSHLGERASESFWFFVGRWLGDGWIVDAPRKGRKASRMKKAMLCCAKDEQGEVDELLARAGFHATRSVERTVVKYHISKAELVDFLAPFSRGAANKELPSYVHHLPKALQQALWQGWISADGCSWASGAIQGGTVSKKLALGMARVCRNAFGKTPALRLTKTNGESIIEGRKVKSSPWWRLILSQGDSTTSTTQDGFVWAKVRSNESTGRRERVYNIAVEGDESYVVEGALVHNCQPFSIAGVSKKASMGRAHGFEDKTQGTLFFDVARIIKAKRPKAFMLENVKNLLSHDKGRTFQVIRETLEQELGYKVQWRVVDASAWVPQRRERLLIVGFRKDAGFDFDDLIRPAQGPKMASILHPADGSEGPCPFTGPAGEPLAKYTVTDGLWSYLQGYAAKHKAAGNGFGFGLVDGASVARTLSARYYKDGSEILVSQGPGKNPRRLTPRECARLMGFPEHQEIPVSDSQAYKQFGNSVVVPAIEAVAQLMAPCVLRLIEREREAAKRRQGKAAAKGSQG